MNKQGAVMTYLMLNRLAGITVTRMIGPSFTLQLANTKKELKSCKATKLVWSASTTSKTLIFRCTARMTTLLRGESL